MIPFLRLYFYTPLPPNPEKNPITWVLCYLPLQTQGDISIEPLVQIANWNQCSVKPLRNALEKRPRPWLSIRPPQVRNHQRESRGGVCARLNTPPAPAATEKDPNGSVGDHGFEGGYSSRGASPQNLQNVATDLLRLPYPALDHFHPLRGPAKTLDRQQLRVRRGTKWTLFREKKQPVEGATHFWHPSGGCLFTSDTKETISEQLFKKNK